jgi:hypothetical protein
MKKYLLNKLSVSLFILLFNTFNLSAQSLSDAVYLSKKELCVGLLYAYDSWKEYWEGTFKRENLNLGTVSTQSMQVMGTYGLTDKLNVIVGLPYIRTEASAGTLAGQNGLQDIMAGLKYQFFAIAQDKHQINLSAVVGGSLPVSKYTPDLLPLSIGFQSKTVFGRLLANYRWNQNLTFTAQATYTSRSNVTLDRESYYTTHQIYSKEVAMPDVFSFGVRAGYRSKSWSAEAMYEQMDCLSGFDIRRNDMPFVSNEMDMSRIGLMGSYTIPQWADLQLMAQLRYTLTGRNVGQSTGFSIGVMKAFGFAPAKELEIGN